MDFGPPYRHNLCLKICKLYYTAETIKIQVSLSNGCLNIVKIVAYIDGGKVTGIVYPGPRIPIGIYSYFRLKSDHDWTISCKQDISNEIKLRTSNFILS